MHAVFRSIIGSREAGSAPRWRIALVASATAVALTAAAVPSYASSSDTNDAVAAAAAAVAQVAAGTVVPPEQQADGTFVATGEHETVLPSTGDGAIQALGVSVGLPGSPESGEVAEDGSVVYLDGGAGFDTVVQNLGDSVRIQTVLDEPAASGLSEFSYGLEGAEPVLRDDGGVDLTVPVEGAEGYFTSIVASVDAPWALDADGTPLPTEYTIEGDAIVQSVRTDESTVFPVVADPRISYGVGIYVSLNKTEIRSLATVAGAIAAVSASAGCVVLGTKLGDAKIGPWVGYACGALGIDKVISTVSSLPSLASSYYTKACYQARIPATSPAWKSVASSQCQPLDQSFTW